MNTLTIPRVFGTCRVAGFIVTAGESHSYVIKDPLLNGSVLPGIRYRKSFLIGICANPATVLRMWKGKEEVDLKEAEIITGEDGILCARFDEYELGNSDRIPNFTFEVRNVVEEEEKSLGEQLFPLMNITININAIDAQSGAEFIAKNKRAIAEVVQNAMKDDHPTRRS